jgi:hypothetical protein
MLEVTALGGTTIGVDDDAREPDPSEEEPDFFDRICDEVSSARRDGKPFAPDAIAATLSNPSRIAR